MGLVNFRSVIKDKKLPPHLASSEKWEKFLQTHPEYEKVFGKAYFLTELIYLFAKTYCGLEVKGIENIPYGKRFVWTHNHSGWVAFDAALIGHLISRHNKTNTYHWDFQRMGIFSLLKYFLPQGGDFGVTFWNNTAIKMPVLRQIFRIFHGLPVSILKTPELLRGYNIYGTPAEGEEGSCKSSFTELYQLKRFHTGIARLALETQSEYVLPAMILGPEETFLSLGAFRPLRKIIGTILPLPLPIPPLPSKWMVTFLPPLNVKKFQKDHQKAKTREDKSRCFKEIVAIVKDKIQKEINEEMKHRKPFRPWPLNGRNGYSR